jgi:hypothetical protein
VNVEVGSPVAADARRVWRALRRLATPIRGRGVSWAPPVEFATGVAVFTIVVVVIVLAAPDISRGDTTAHGDWPSGYQWARWTALAMLLPAGALAIAARWVDRAGPALEGGRPARSRPYPDELDPIEKRGRRLLLVSVVGGALLLGATVALSGGPILSPFGQVLLACIIFAELLAPSSASIVPVAVLGTALVAVSALLSETAFESLSHPVGEMWSSWDFVPSAGLVVITSTFLNIASRKHREREAYETGSGAPEGQK